jgi:hypothetical protein
VLFHTYSVDESASMNFKFVHGLVVAASGGAVILREGDLREHPFAASGLWVHILGYE